ncbi:MAG: serine/threonine protein kinase, partial [Candidatus Aminicenantes bacterium]|nr:serine/threonine protein kinase [Candidatus Aminicenantes bacterium]
MKTKRWEQDLNLKLVKSKIGERFDVTKKLGGGGYANVFKIKHKILGTEFALKIMDRDRLWKEIDDESEDDKKVKKNNYSNIIGRFINEAQVCSKINHKNVVKINDVESVFDEEEDLEVVYLIMEFIDGTPLKKKMKKLDIDSVFRIIRNILSALDKTHGAGIIHRDIKSSNVMLRKDTEEAVLIDFGLAKDSFGQMDLTKTGMSLGTNPYMSPEQFNDLSSVTKTTDIYSSGVLLYEMITGKLPFGKAGNVGIGKNNIPNIGDATPKPPPGLQKVLERAMAKNPKDRYQSAKEFLDDIKKIENKYKERKKEEEQKREKTEERKREVAEKSQKKKDVAEVKKRKKNRLRKEAAKKKEEERKRKEEKDKKKTEVRKEKAEIWANRFSRMKDFSKRYSKLSLSLSGVIAAIVIIFVSVDYYRDYRERQYTGYIESVKEYISTGEYDKAGEFLSKAKGIKDSDDIKKLSARIAEKQTEAMNTAFQALEIGEVLEDNAAKEEKITRCRAF